MADITPIVEKTADVFSLMRRTGANALARYQRTEPLLKIDHVSLTFGDRIILRDVCAEIDDVVRPDCVTGQVVCFLGPSGIGKTQLSRIMAGLQAPTTGQVLVDEPLFVGGQRTTRLRTVHKGMVGMVPQNYPLFEFATVADNFLIAGRMAGLSATAASNKAKQFVADFGLESYLSMYPPALSGGTRQRVAIVRQLMCSEHYLVMDEPFSGLDPIMKHKACDLITQVADRDELNTIIIVTHDIAEGLSVADTVWLMGREKDQPGARVVRQIDLAEMDLCWRPGIQQEPRFQALVADVKASFAELV